MWYPTYSELRDANIVTHVLLGQTIISIKDYCDKAACDSHSTAPQWVQRAAARLNLSAPRKVDSTKIFERAVAGPDKQITFRYTVVPGRRIDFDEMDAYIEQVACTYDGITLYIDRGIGVRYIYSDTTGKILFRKSVSPADCPGRSSDGSPAQ